MGDEHTPDPVDLIIGIRLVGSGAANDVSSSLPTQLAGRYSVSR